MSERSLKVIAPHERVLVEQPVSPGFRREAAFATDRYWVGVATIDPGASTGWHHHGDYDTFLYTLSGTTGRLEWGPGGTESAAVPAGTMAYVPKGVVHREVNGNEPIVTVLVRIGTGEPVTQVDGPDPVKHPQC